MLALTASSGCETNRIASMGFMMENDYIKATGNAIAIVTAAMKEITINVSYRSALSIASHLGFNLTEDQKKSILNDIEKEADQSMDTFIAGVKDLLP